MTISVTRGAAQAGAQPDVYYRTGQVTASLFGSLCALFRPFITLVAWQIFFGMFAYFYPDAVVAWENFTHVPWTVVAVVFAFVKLARKP